MRSLCFWLCLVFAISCPAQAEPLRVQVLVGLHKPPYIDLTSSSGYELELLTALFAAAGMRAEFTHVPNGRLLPLFKSGAFDAVTLQPMHSTLPEYFYSCPYIHYQNVVTTLADGKLDIQSLADLARQRVIAFQTAEQVLGEEFRWVVTQMTDYSETVDQKAQVDMLLRGRADAIILDRNILGHHLDALALEPALKLFNLPGGFYRLAFHRPELAAAFDQAQQHLWQQPAFGELQLRHFRQANQNLQPACDQQRR